MEIGLPWVEKYRPKKLADVVGQAEITKRLKSYVETHNLPNAMFSGPAGTGKTSSAVALAKELFKENFDRNFFELNASDSRGIDVVRGQIKDFARTLAFDADFKIIFLDESDALTDDAQQALRRTMEKYTKTCRFLLSCVTPDTKIVLPEEIETTMKEFMETFKEEGQASVLTKNECSGNIESDAVIFSIQQNPVDTGKKVIELTTNSGRVLKATNDHLLFTDAGWKKVEELNIGDKLVVFPHLEGTLIEKNCGKIVAPEAFEEFLLKYEETKGYTRLASAKVFKELNTREKQRIIEKAKELFKVIETGCGLTEREKQVFEIIKANVSASREFVQKRIMLSRIRTVQLLKSIEQKGFVARRIEHNRTHCFETTGKEPLQLRNKMDIRKALEKEFGIKISYTCIKKHLERPTPLQGGIENTIEELNKKGLLSINYGDKKIGPFVRIFGFIYGDGHITKTGRIIFTGNNAALEEVRKDLASMGFRGSKIQVKQVNSRINGRAIYGKTTSFFTDSCPLSRFLAFLGAPQGDKIISKYSIPKWIMNGTKFVKREFLRSLFGCEGYSPRIKDKNFDTVTLRMHKSRQLKQNMVRFYEQLKRLLDEFEVKSYTTIRELGTKRKDGHVTDIFELNLGGGNENLLKFFGRIGYAYEKEKCAKARLAAEYLRCKAYCIELQKQKATIILEETSGLSKRATAKKYNCSLDFVINQFKGKKIHIPRTFPTFTEWKKEFDAGNGFAFNKLTQIKEIECTDVRDITCTKNHNFIANGIISHNCNYSSRIIEPIQSRCVVFRFKPLTAKEIEERLQQIAKEEKLSLDDKAVKAIVYVCQGDMRKAVNVLQAAGSLTKKIEEKTVFEVSNRARPEEIKEMIQLALKGKFLEAREKLDTLMYEHGMSGEDIISQLYRETMSMKEEELDSKTKIALVDEIGEYDFRITEGANERVQIEALLAQFMKYKK